MGNECMLVRMAFLFVLWLSVGDPHQENDEFLGNFFILLSCGHVALLVTFSLILVGPSW